MLEVLNVVKKLAVKLENAIEKVVRLKSIAEKVTNKMHEVSGSMTGYVDSRLADILALLAEKQNRIALLTEVKQKCLYELYQWLDKYLEYPAHFEIIFMRYGLLKTFGQIAAELHRSKSSIFRLHTAALKVLKSVDSVESDKKMGLAWNA